MYIFLVSRKAWFLTVRADPFSFDPCFYLSKAPKVEINKNAQSIHKWSNSRKTSNESNFVYFCARQLFRSIQKSTSPRKNAVETDLVYFSVRRSATKRSIHLELLPHKRKH